MRRSRRKRRLASGSFRGKRRRARSKRTYSISRGGTRL